MGGHAYRSTACETIENMASNVDEMTESGKDEGKDRWDVLTVAVLVSHRKQDFNEMVVFL